jgi:hypothetical protein
MIVSKLLRTKSFIKNANGESIPDLISSTYKFDENGIALGNIFVSEFEVMRPDLMSTKVYSAYDNWDVLLKYNGISNPFSLDLGDILLVPSINKIRKMITAPRVVPEKGTEPQKKNEQKIMNPKSDKDKRRLESLRTKVSEVVPPNVNLTGAQNVRVVDGIVIFGPDMTQNASSTQSNSLARSRVQDQLKNNGKF